MAAPPPASALERAEATKEYLSARLAQRQREMKERRERLAALKEALNDPSLTDAGRDALRAGFDAREVRSGAAALQRDGSMTYAMRCA